MLKIIKKVKVLALLAVSTLVPAVCSAQVTVSADAGINSGQIVVANDAIERTQDFMNSMFGVKLDMDVDVHLYSGMLSERKDVGGNSTPGKISIWLEPNTSPYQTAFLVSHELTHQYQIEQVGKDTLNQNMWFTEGMADIIGVQTADVFDKSKVKVFYRSALNKTRKSALSPMWIERKSAWTSAHDKGLPVYAKADISMFYLTANYPAQCMWSYLYNLKSSNNADEAFEKTYGFPITELDARVDIYTEKLNEQI